MAHTVSGLIAKRAPLIEAAAAPWVVAPMAQGFGIALRSDVRAYPDEPLPGELTALALVLKDTTAVAAVVTGYFGGDGSQAAAAWAGPDAIAYSECSTAINTALEFLGVCVNGACDEFDAIGLGWFRSNDDWIEFAKNGKLHFERAPWPPAYAVWLEHTKSH